MLLYNFCLSSTQEAIMPPPHAEQLRTGWKWGA
jgi:hypothetical protein